MVEERQQRLKRHTICPADCPYEGDRLNHFCGFCMLNILKETDEAKEEDEIIQKINC